METKQIIFTKINTAELCDVPVYEPGDGQVLVKMAYTAISRGTERANITGDPNISIFDGGAATVHFPRALGYSGSGIVEKTGAGVRGVKVGDRVAVLNSQHRGYCTVHGNQVIPIRYDDVSLEEAAFAYICTFPLAAVRKTRVELGEAAIVMGQGILGAMAVQFLHAAGAYPVIAADPVPSRRDFALTIGADLALDPTDADFAAQVKESTQGGCNAAIEVSGQGKALDTVLDCMAKCGRVALLGCTRDPNFTIDYYRKIHGPGITLIGAHTLARPDTESHPGWWTHRDDMRATLALQHGGRIHIDRILSEIHDPTEAQAVYDRVIGERDFPQGVLFRWNA